MTSVELKKVCEGLGFGIAHARRVARSEEVRAYIAVRHDDYPEVDELRWHPASPKSLRAYKHDTKANGYTQYDRLISIISIP